MVRLIDNVPEAECGLLRRQAPQSVTDMALDPVDHRRQQTFCTAIAESDQPAPVTGFSPQQQAPAFWR